MSDRDRDRDRDRVGGRDPDDEQREPHRVKVTDRRRVRVESDEGPDASPIPPEEAGRDDGGTTLARPPPVEPGGKPVLGVAEPAGGEDKDPAAALREAAEYREHLQRLQAEFANYRKRVLKEQTRAVEMASEPFVRRLIEVVDEFELALMAADRKPDFEKFLRGVEMVYAKLLDILRAEGVERIEALHEPFDPQLHEALMQAGEGDGEPVVTDVLRQGYRMRGRVLRPAGVKVTRS